MKKIIILIFLVQWSFSDTLTITFLGDTHFGENYQAQTNLINENGYDYFFANVKSLLLESDFTFVNLESPLTNGTLKTNSSEKYVHYSNMDSTPFYLDRYNIRAVSLANNHILDLGIEGLNLTISSLNSYDVASFGAGNEEYAALPFNKKFVKGEKEFDLYVFGAYWYRSKFDKEKKYYAEGNKAGVNLLNTEKISSQVKKIREQNPNAFIVLYPHWGSNYKNVNDYQKETARKLIDSGVDLIIGHGSHTLQDFEQYNGKWILYNIGNFIFNAPGRYTSTQAKPFGLMVKLVIIDDKKLLRLYPVYTNNLETDYRLRFLDEDEFDECYDYISGSNKGFKKAGFEYFEIVLTD